MLETLMNSLATQPQPGRILWELACCVASSVGADGFVLHLVHPQTNVLHVFRRYGLTKSTSYLSLIFSSFVFLSFYAF